MTSGASVLPSNIHCMPRQMPKKDAPCAIDCGNRILECRMHRAASRGGEVTDAGHNDVSRAANDFGIFRDLTFAAEMLERLAHRGQIARRDSRRA